MDGNDLTFREEENEAVMPERCSYFLDDSDAYNYAKNNSNNISDKYISLTLVRYVVSTCLFQVFAVLCELFNAILKHLMKFRVSY